jgi:hypothetical protein
MVAYHRLQCFFLDVPPPVPPPVPQVRSVTAAARSGRSPTTGAPPTSLLSSMPAWCLAPAWRAPLLATPLVMQASKAHCATSVSQTSSSSAAAASEQAAAPEINA